MTCEFCMGCGLGDGAEQIINYWLVMMSRAPRMFPKSVEEGTPGKRRSWGLFPSVELMVGEGKLQVCCELDGKDRVVA
jgi:hypothetical protein